MGDKVVFIGEMVVAAFDATTGRQTWWNGIAPIHQDANTDALKRRIDREAFEAASFVRGGSIRRGHSNDLSRQYQAQADGMRWFRYPVLLIKNGKSTVS